MHHRHGDRFSPISLFYFHFLYFFPSFFSLWEKNCHFPLWLCVLFSRPVPRPQTSSVTYLVRLVSYLLSLFLSLLWFCFLYQPQTFFFALLFPFSHVSIIYHTTVISSLLIWLDMWCFQESPFYFNFFNKSFHRVLTTRHMTKFQQQAIWLLSTPNVSWNYDATESIKYHSQSKECVGGLSLEAHCPQVAMKWISSWYNS